MMQGQPRRARAMQADAPGAHPQKEGGALVFFAQSQTIAAFSKKQNSIRRPQSSELTAGTPQRLSEALGGTGVVCELVGNSGGVCGKSVEAKRALVDAGWTWWAWKRAKWPSLGWPRGPWR